MDTQPKVLVDIDPQLKAKMRELLDALVTHLFLKKPDDPVCS